MALSRIGIVLGLVLGVVGCDQGTKRLAQASLQDAAPVSLLDGIVRLTYAENTGAWGSLGASWPEPLKLAVLVVAPLLVLIGVLVHALRRPGLQARSVAGMALLVGGGFGNLIDRVLEGYVIDFMWVGVGRLGTNIFNVADVALLAGVGLILLSRDVTAPRTAPRSEQA